MALGTCELLWLDALLNSFEITVSHAALYCDNQAAIHIASNPIFHERTKHIDVDCHFVRDHVRSCFLKLFHVHSMHQLADIFTKNLHQPLFRTLVSKLGLLNIHGSLA